MTMETSRVGDWGGGHRKHPCHEQIAAAFGKLINPQCSRSTQHVEILWRFVGIQCIYCRVTSHNYVLNAAPYTSLSLWQPFLGSEWQSNRKSIAFNSIRDVSRSKHTKCYIYDMIALILSDGQLVVLWSSFFFSAYVVLSLLLWFLCILYTNDSSATCIGNLLKVTLKLLKQFLTHRRKLLNFK